MTLDEIDLFIPHQANRHMLEHLRDKMGIAPERFFIGMEDCGNTVSASIPIAIQQARQQGRIKGGTRAMVIGFGVGYSWGACILLSRCDQTRTVCDQRRTVAKIDGNWRMLASAGA